MYLLRRFVTHFTESIVLVEVHKAVCKPAKKTLDNYCRWTQVRTLQTLVTGVEYLQGLEFFYPGWFSQRKHSVKKEWSATKKRLGTSNQIGDIVRSSSMFSPVFFPCAFFLAGFKIASICARSARQSRIIENENFLLMESVFH